LRGIQTSAHGSVHSEGFRSKSPAFAVRLSPVRRTGGTYDLVGRLPAEAPDPGSAALIALVHALKCEHKIVDPRLSGLSRRQLRARAEQIAQSSWTSQALRQMIDATTAAVKAAAVASASAG